MSILISTSRIRQETSLFESLRNTVVAFFEGIQDGVDMADRYHTLSRMSDKQLAKRGLNRTDVPRAALLGRGRS